MKRGITSRTQLVFALLGAGLVSMACTTIELVNYKLAPTLQLAYGKAYIALRDLGEATRAIPLLGGNNCRFTGPIADCVDGGVVPNVPIGPVDPLLVSTGMLAFNATIGAKGTLACADVTYCPPGAAARFRDAVACKVEACPIPNSIDPGCVINSCLKNVLDDRLPLQR